MIVRCCSVPLPSPFTRNTVVDSKQALHASAAHHTIARVIPPRCHRIARMRKRTLIVCAISTVVAAGGWRVAASATQQPAAGGQRLPVVAKDVTVLGFRLHYLEAGRG